MSKTTNAPPIHSVRSEKHEDPFNDLGDFDIPLPPRKRRRSDKSGSWEEADSLVDSEVSGVTPSNRDFTGLARSKAASPLQRHHSSPRGDSQYLSISASSDGSVIGDRSEPSSPLKRVAVDLSVTTAALLAELSSGAPSRHTLQGTDQPKQRRKSKKGKQNGTQRSKTPDETGEPNAAQQTALSKAEKAQAKEEEKQRRQAERKAATEERKAQKEAEKARKQLAKEEKEREKKKDKEEALELAAANRARWDKSISITEMAVDLPASIDGKEIGKAIRAALKSSNIEASTYNSILPDIIRFRRKVSSRFNEELGYWEPAPESVNVEKQVVCLISGQHLLSMAIAADADEGLDAYVGMVRAKYPDFRVTCLVEGLDQVVKDARKASSRAYEASVRRQGQPSAAEGDTSRAQTGTLQKQLAPDEIKGKVDEALLELQVAHWCLIHQTETPADTADFVATLTEQMSTIPYKSVRPGGSPPRVTNR